MSASPSGLPNGNSHPQPPRGAGPLRRKPRPADPLVARKKPPARPRPPPSASASTHIVGSKPSQLPPLADDSKALAEFEARRKQNNGWTDPPPPPESGYRDIPLVTTKRALREGIRFHVMRFAKPARNGEEEPDIDPSNPADFPPPVSLHRRDPRQPPPGHKVKEEAPPPPVVDDEAAEKLAQEKAKREAQRAIDMAQIAPTVKDANPKRPQQQQKKEKAIQVYYPKNTKTTTEQKKESEIRYEEALPWHLEDADGKNVWVGSYVQALSEANVAFVIDGPQFRMVPLEKFYRFIQKPPFQAYTTEQAEDLMNKKMFVGRWDMRDKEKQKDEEEREATRKTLRGGVRVKSESSTFRNAPRSEKEDHDDIDMEDDEFQDDDENVGLEPDLDEDAKDTRERMRRNHLGANLFGEADEQEVAREEAEEKVAKKNRELGKEIRKSLAKREDHLEYLESESEGSDFLESSSDEEETKEEQGEEKDKKDGDSKAKADSKEKAAAGGTSKSTTAASGKSKAGDAAKKGKSLKRPGSPNLSESSGNESSRKKAKKQATGSVMPSRSSTPLPGQQRAKAKGGAVSDGEATAGEMSDGAPAKKKIKLVGTGAKGTPVGSRAGSPAPAAQSQLAQGSNPASPMGGGSPTSRAGSPGGSPSGPVEAWEIVEALKAAPEGISVGALIRHFGTRVGEGPGQMMRKDWIKLVKDNAIFGKDKLLRPKAPSAEGS